MIHNCWSNIYCYLLALVASLGLACCTEDIVVTPGVETGGEISVGEAVQFTALLPDATNTTRASAKEQWQQKVNCYKPVNHSYTFKVEMYKENDVDPKGYCYYEPQQTTNIGSLPISDYDGTLSNCTESVLGETKSALFWQDNVNKWGFKATTISSEEIETDQSSQTKWLKQDKLTGYSYLPAWTGDENFGYGTDPEVMQYKTSKQWYADNKAANELSGIMTTAEECKKIPLYFKHDRAWITVILKAGEGVKRDALKYATSDQNIRMTINSYKTTNDGTAVTAIDKAWSSEELIDYGKDPNGGPESNVSTTRYDAIVMPHDYSNKKDEEIIAKINLSEQNFSFYASNDNRYVNGTEAEKAEANADYNLTAGKHLTIIATLSRESRKILITAWIEDWTEVATMTICDDYGQNGDPTIITNRKDLIDFLRDPDLNKAGNVGIISPLTMDLDTPCTEESAEGVESGIYPTAGWASTYTLNATLNLAGCTFKSSRQLFDGMSSTATLVNGKVEIKEGSEIACAIANKNEGTIERVDITTASELTTAKATIAGMVKVNNGTIYQCTSNLPVYGTVGESMETKNYIGGIAAVSVPKDASSMSVIDGCVVNASVDGNTTVYGGGIVGYVTGRVSNNTFQYGITVGQELTNYKNIFAQAGNTDTRAYGNSWPTLAKNPISSSDADVNTNPNNNSGAFFDAVLDCQAELDKIMKDASLNAKGKNYRISKSFTVSSSNTAAEDWTHGTVNQEDYSAGENNVSFNLYGNDKTITLTGTKTVSLDYGQDAQNYETAPMLFNCILGEIRDLNIYLEKPLIAEPSKSKDSHDQEQYNRSDAIAPLAYAVYGGADKSGKITNVTVKAKIDSEHPESNAFVQASAAAGLVVWAYGDATISQCRVKTPVKMCLFFDGEVLSEERKFSGGIVSCASAATITQCVYLGDTQSYISGISNKENYRSVSTHFYGGIVGGTSTKISTEVPKLQITDCTSWYIAPAENPDFDGSCGSIIGFCSYIGADANKTIYNAMAESNEGNWWPLSSVGAKSYVSGKTEENMIGKKNSVTPLYDQNF